MNYKGYVLVNKIKELFQDSLSGNMSFIASNFFRHCRFCKSITPLLKSAIISQSLEIYGNVPFESKLGIDLKPWCALRRSRSTGGPPRHFGVTVRRF
ncbi:hypothetical protein TNCV_3072481 [Trichonephila clavipes]|nr:hypothetical protein TNCV_3072481 [Trichonephila clavipes]